MTWFSTHKLYMKETVYYLWYNKETCRLLLDRKDRRETPTGVFVWTLDPCESVHRSIQQCSQLLYTSELFSVNTNNTTYLMVLDPVLSTSTPMTFNWQFIVPVYTYFHWKNSMQHDKLNRYNFYFLQYT